MTYDAAEFEEASVECDECGDEVKDTEDVYCDDCYNKLKDKIEKLEIEIEHAENRELELNKRIEEMEDKIKEQEYTITGLEQQIAESGI